MNLFECTLAGGGSGAVLTVSCNQVFAGLTITCTDGTTTLTKKCPSSSPYEVVFTIPEDGTWTVSGTINGTTYSDSVEVQVNYSAELKPIVYGFHVDSTKSDSAQAVSYQVQYNGENVKNYNYSPAYMDFTNDKWEWGDWSEDNFFMPRPCLIKQDYSEVIYLDPSDYTKDVDGNNVSAKLTGSTDGYNAMVEWGKDGKRIWYKIVPDTDPTSYTVYIADSKLDNDFHAWSFYDENDNLAEHFYTSIYNGSAVSTVMRSLSGKTPTASQAGATQIAYAKANNKNSETYAWYIDVYADRILINLLLILVIKSLNSDVVGYGNYSATGAINTGTGDTKGAFYGKQNSSVVKMFHMENWFGNCWRRMAGLITNAGQFQYKLTYGVADGSSAAGYIESDSAPTNYLTGDTITTAYTSSYIMKEKARSDGSLLPSVFDGANATYYSDGFWNSTTNIRYARVGGSRYESSAAGAFALIISGALSVSGGGSGCAISLKPVVSP